MLGQDICTKGSVKSKCYHRKYSAKYIIDTKIKAKTLHAKDGTVYTTEFIPQKAEEMALQHLSQTSQKAWTEIKKLCGKKRKCKLELVILR